MFKTLRTLILVFVALFLITPTNTFAAFEDEYEYTETKVWGGTDSDNGYSVAVDSNSRDVYVTGSFQETVDFDATEGVDEHTALGINDVFLTKYNADGSYGWTRVWGSAADDVGNGVTVVDGVIYVTGFFQETVDFDSTDGTDEQTFVSGYDVFLTKYNSDGSYGWTRTWGGTNEDYSQSVTVEDGEVYVTGVFRETVDFDATEGVDEHSSLGQDDVFLTKYNSDGSYGWTRTWGDEDTDYGNSVTVVADEIYITGNFRGTVDFDATDGIDEHTTSGYLDVYLTKYRADGSYGWTRTWSVTSSDDSRSVTGEDGAVYVVGKFTGTADFDATDGIDEYTSFAYYYDAFLTKYNSDGSYGWTRTWGGTNEDYSQSVTVEDGEVYVTGVFRETVDFDATEGVDEHSSLGQDDVFLTKYNSDGSYGWTRTWGSPEGGESEGSDFGYGVTVANGELYVTGGYYFTVDFDTSGGTDEYTSAGSHDVFLSKYSAIVAYGCTDIDAQNYDPEADQDNSSCIFSSDAGSGGTNIRKRVANLIEKGETKAAEAIIERNENIFSITTESNSPAPTLIETLQTQLQELLKQFKDLTGTDFQTVSTPSLPARDLDLDMEGKDVTQLQTFLIKQGYTILAGATGYFGTQTQTALSNYQKDHNITPAIGYFGPITQKYLKQANIPGLWW